MSGVQRAGPERIDPLASTFGRAFVNEPMMLWPMGLRGDLAGSLTRCFRYFLELALVLGVVWEVADGKGAAVWVSPEQAFAWDAARPWDQDRIRALTDDGGRRNVTIYAVCKHRPVVAAIVREAGPADVEEVVSGYEWLFAPPGSRPTDWDPGRAATAVRRVIASDASVVLVAELDGELVGLCTAYDDIESVRYGRRVWVEDLAVHPERRSLGIGSQLLGEATRWAKQRGATHLELDSAQARTDAHRFYMREGSQPASLSFRWVL